MMKPDILVALDEMGFATFTGEYDLNLVGVRSDNPIPNRYNDKFYVVYQENGQWVQHVFPFTSLAGTYWLNKPSRPTGTAILCHDKQYRSCWQLGLHRGSYEALVQTGNEVSVWRDNNKDDHADYDCPVETGYFGINCHRASRDRKSTNVDRWSAGCQVFANPSHFAILIKLVKLQIAAGLGDKCSYTLIKESTLNNRSISCPAEESKSQSKSRKASSPSSLTRSKKSSKPKTQAAKAVRKSPKKKGKK
jgi:hypothetical protein